MKSLLTCFLLIGLVIFTKPAYSQQTKLDSLFAKGDSTAVLDSLMRDFSYFLDSLSKPKSFFTISAAIGTGYFSFENKNTFLITASKKPIVSPSAGYYHKSGFGLSATAFAMLDGKNTQFYQASVSPSFDLVGNRKLGTGIAYTRYMEKDSLSFYTTPIENEVYTYFTYKKWWVRPTISFSYGWGSKTEYQKKQTWIWIQRLQRYERGFVYVENEESVRDFAAILSLKHDFDFYDILVKDDGFTITPVFLFTAATQNFGFNTSYSYSFTTIRANLLPSTQNISDNSGFRPQSASLIVRCDYNLGKFFVMPQFLLDYYIPSTDKHLNSAYSLTAGFNF